MDQQKGRQLSVAEKTPLHKTHSSQDRQHSVAASTLKTNEKGQGTSTSKLFDYEKTRPRSRRELQAGLDAHKSIPTPGVSGQPSSSHIVPVASNRNIQAGKSRALDASKMTNLDVVNMLTGGCSQSELKRLSKKSVNIIDAKSSHATSRDGHRTTLASVSQERRRSTTAGIHDTDSGADSTPLIRVESTEDDGSDRLKHLYEMAIDSVERAESVNLMRDTSKQNLLTRLQGTHSGSASMAAGSGLDHVKFKELETILNDARIHAAKKSSSDDHSRVDVGSNRAQKRRIEHLEQVLNALKPHEDAAVDFDPAKVLQCRYLRLSTSNVEQMEQMMIESGQDPGIHVHKDVTDMDIWSGLKEERTDLQVHTDTKSLAKSESKFRKPQ